MHAITAWILVSLTMHQPLPSHDPYAFATLGDCQHAIQVMQYRQSDVSCRKMTYLGYGEGVAAPTPAQEARGQRNAAYDMNKLQAILQSTPPQTR